MRNVKSLLVFIVLITSLSAVAQKRVDVPVCSTQ